MPGTTPIPRPPVVAVMGHIDHGKSTLLDFIRRTKVAEEEVGGITQCISAYEVSHKEPNGNIREITFLDTPGHEAFTKIRARGASVADVAILVVSAEDGVKPQTLDALKAIRGAAIPFIVAINKIDKPNADIDKTKASLAENEIYVEGYGGEITVVPISAKTGEGVGELLDMILLTSDVLGHTAIRNENAKGVIIEACTLERIGICATLVIKSGTLHVGETVVCGDAYAPIRYIENFKSEKIKEASFSSPVRITGWSKLPKTGEKCVAYKNRKEAEKSAEENEEKQVKAIEKASDSSKVFTIPIIIKADAQGAIDAIFHEIEKINTDAIAYKVIYAGVGNIGEHDVKLASTKDDTIMIGFGVNIDKQAEAMRERLEIEAKYFTIIYELGDYLKDLLLLRTPKKMVEELQGSLKVLKFFSKVKDKQVIGGKVEAGTIVKDAMVKIIRRENELGQGFIRELQMKKVKTGSVEEGNECGLLLEAKVEVAPGDKLESYVSVEK